MSSIKSPAATALQPLPQPPSIFFPPHSHQRFSTSPLSTTSANLLTHILLLPQFHQCSSSPPPISPSPTTHPVPNSTTVLHLRHPFHPLPTPIPPFSFHNCRTKKNTSSRTSSSFPNFTTVLHLRHPFHPLPTPIPPFSFHNRRTKKNTAEQKIDSLQNKSSVQNSE